MSDLSKKIFRDGKHYVTSSFGWRIHPITRKKTFHNGTDYGTNSKKISQYGIEDGKVLSAGTDGVGGKFAWVEYPRLRIKLLYYHLDSVKVKKGQNVTKNTLIGYTGKTGQATGIHLHLSVYDLKANKYLNPDTYKIPVQSSVDKTNSYIKKYQTISRGLKLTDGKGKLLVVDGSAGASTQYVMNKYYLKRNSRNKIVGLLQEMLKAQGYYKGSIDNSFGNATLTAVKNFQKDNKLVVDGQVGSKTMTKILTKM